MLIRLKAIAAILCLFSTFQTYAQSDDVRTMLEQRVEETNKVLPISVQQGLVFKKKYIDGFSVYEIHEINEMYISFSMLKHRKAVMKKSLLERYGKDANLRAFAEMVVDCKMHIVIRYVSLQSDESFEIVLKTKELEKCLE